MRPQLLQGRQRASKRARRVVSATRSEKRAVMSSAINEQLHRQHVAKQPMSALVRRDLVSL
jgi:hypothetical protein